MAKLAATAKPVMSGPSVARSASSVARSRAATSPALRTRWEGPIVITEHADGGRRGVGTTAQCITGRLATLEEIVDWQPYERVAWRLTVPDLGPVTATAELEAGDGPTRLRVRWAVAAGRVTDPAVVERIRVERKAAYARLERAIAGSVPVIEQQEVRA